MRSWVITLCAVVLAMGSLLHPRLIHAGDPLLSHYGHSEQHETTAAKRDIGAPGDDRPGHSHDGYVNGCAIGGCGFCSPEPVAAAMAPIAVKAVGTALSARAHSLAIVPPLPPPILHA
jgi:hypothetical protein